MVLFSDNIEAFSKGPKTSCFNLERTCSTSCDKEATIVHVPEGRKISFQVTDGV